MKDFAKVAQHGCVVHCGVSKGQGAARIPEQALYPVSAPNVAELSRHWSGASLTLILMLRCISLPAIVFFHTCEGKDETSESVTTEERVLQMKKAK